MGPQIHRSERIRIVWTTKDMAGHELGVAWSLRTSRNSTTEEVSLVALLGTQIHTIERSRIVRANKYELGTTQSIRIGIQPKKRFICMLHFQKSGKWSSCCFSLLCISSSACRYLKIVY